MNKKLIAIDPCIMEDDGKPTLTVGKEYEVFNGRPYGKIMVLDDNQENHYFKYHQIKEFFEDDPSFNGPNSKLIEAIELFSSSYPEEEIMQVTVHPEEPLYKVTVYSSRTYEIDMERMCIGDITDENAVRHTEIDG